MCSEFSWCVNRSEFKLNYRKTIDAIDDTELSGFNKILLRKRFIPMVNMMEIEAKRANTGYSIFQLITTMGSIMVPALLSIEDKTFSFNSTDIDQERQSHNLFWLTWGISIAVTISNAFNQLLGLEGKYITRNIHVSQMKKEGWSFLEKSGDLYCQFPNKSRNEVINIFWKRVETLRHNQIKNDLSFDNMDDLMMDLSDIPLDLSANANAAAGAAAAGAGAGAGAAAGAGAGAGAASDAAYVAANAAAAADADAAYVAANANAAAGAAAYVAANANAVGVSVTYDDYSQSTTV
jgi:hypothetical protein